MPRPGYYVCPQCGQEGAPQPPHSTCPHCGAAGLGTSPQPMPVGSLPAATQSFPERMKANKALAGRICPGCQAEVELGQEVWNCPQCQNTMHQACHEAGGACLNPNCTSALQLAGGAPAAPQAPAAAPAGQTKPCPYCSEPIPQDARKCRFCGEVLDKAGRLRQQRMKKQFAEDENLSVAEILFGILCGLIACIFGIVWMLQGKKKGGKLILVVIITQLVFLAIRLAAGAH